MKRLVFVLFICQLTYSSEQSPAQKVYTVGIIPDIKTQSIKALLSDFFQTIINKIKAIFIKNATSLTPSEATSATKAIRATLNTNAEPIIEGVTSTDGNKQKQAAQAIKQFSEGSGISKIDLALQIAQMTPLPEATIDELDLTNEEKEQIQNTPQELTDGKVASLVGTRAEIAIEEAKQQGLNPEQTQSRLTDAVTGLNEALKNSGVKTPEQMQTEIEEFKKYVKELSLSKVREPGVIEKALGNAFTAPAELGISTDQIEEHTESQIEAIENFSKATTYDQLKSGITDLENLGMEEYAPAKEANDFITKIDVAIRDKSFSELESSLLDIKSGGYDTFQIIQKDLFSGDLDFLTKENVDSLLKNGLITSAQKKFFAALPEVKKQATQEISDNLKEAFQNPPENGDAITDAIEEALDAGLDPIELLEPYKAQLALLSKKDLGNITDKLDGTVKSKFDEMLTASKQEQINIETTKLNDALKNPSSNVNEIKDAFNKITEFGGNAFDILKNSENIKSINASDIKTLSTGLNLTQDQINGIKSIVQSAHSTEISTAQEKLKSALEEPSNQENWDTIFNTINEVQNYGVDPYEILEKLQPNLENLNTDAINKIAQHYSFTTDEQTQFDKWVTNAKQAQITLATKELDTALESLDTKSLTDSGTYEALNKIIKYSGDPFEILSKASGLGLERLSASDIKTLSDAYKFTPDQLTDLKDTVQSLNKYEINQLQEKLEPLFENTDANWNTIFETINKAEKLGVEPYEMLEKVKTRLGNFSPEAIETIAKNYAFTDGEKSSFSEWVGQAQQQQTKIMQDLNDALKNDSTNLDKIKEIFASGKEVALTPDNMFLNATNLDSLTRDNLGKLTVDLGLVSKGKWANKSVELKANTVESKIALMDELDILSDPFTGETTAQQRFGTSSVDAKTFAAIRRLMTAGSLGQPTAEDALFFYDKIVDGLEGMQSSITDLTSKGFFRKRALVDSKANSETLSENLTEIKNGIQKYLQKIEGANFNRMTPDTEPIVVDIDPKASLSDKLAAIRNGMEQAIGQDKFESFLKLLGQNFDTMGKAEEPIFTQLTKSRFVGLSDPEEIKLVTNLNKYMQSIGQTNELLITNKIRPPEIPIETPREKAILEAKQKLLEDAGLKDITIETVTNMQDQVNKFEDLLQQAREAGIEVKLVFDAEKKVYLQEGDELVDSDGKKQSVPDEDRDLRDVPEEFYPEA